MPVSDKRIRILTVDDHPLLREGIAALVEGQPDMELAGEAANGLEAIECYRECHPDITLMDLQMPQMGGIDAMIAIRDRWPDAKVIVLTTASWIAHGLGIAQLLTGSLLLLGWWTPAASACAALLAIGLALSDNRWELHIAQASIAFALLALGPGAWSTDARLYGRKHIDI